MRYFLILYAPMLFRTANIIFGTVLRSVGDTKTPMRVGVVMNIINTVLNFLFIYPTRVAVIAGISITLPGAGFGIEGAALASAIAYTYGGIAITVKLWIRCICFHDQLAWRDICGSTHNRKYSRVRILYSRMGYADSRGYISW